MLSATYIASKTFVLFHETLILLVDFKYLADAVGSCFGLESEKLCHYNVSLFGSSFKQRGKFSFNGSNKQRGIVFFRGLKSSKSQTFCAPLKQW